eukprot:767248-Hanusia_phi.AAC.3
MLQGAGGAVGVSGRASAAGGGGTSNAAGVRQGVVQVGMSILQHEGAAALFLGAPQRMASD